MARKPIYYFDATWSMNFWFFMGWTPESTEKYLAGQWQFDSLHFSGKAGQCIEFDNGKGKSAIVIWLREKPNSKDYLGILCHECVHAPHFLLRRRGVKADFDNDELEAYLTGHLMRIGLGMKVRSNGGFK